MQAAGQVATRQGVGTFVLGAGTPAGFAISPEQYNTLRDVIAVLELRIGVETEAAALAAQRRTEDNLARLRQALAALVAGVEAGQDTVAADFQFHLEVARATQNSHFADLISTLGSMIIPRARLVEPAGEGGGANPERQAYLRRVNAEHESIFDAISAQDSEAARAAMRTHLVNSRERRRRVDGQPAR